MCFRHKILCFGVILLIGLHELFVWNLGFVAIPIDHAILLGLTALTIFAKTDAWRQVGLQLRTFPVAVLFCFLLWLVLCNSMAKEHAYMELRELKNVGLPLFTSYLIVSVYLSDRGRLSCLLASILAGSILLAIVWLSVGGVQSLSSIGSLVRPTSASSFREEYHFGYTSLAVSGAIIVASSGAFWPSRLIGLRVAGVLLFILGCMLVVYTGMRAVLGSIILAPFFLIAMRFAPARRIGQCFSFFFGLVLLVALQAPQLGLVVSKIDDGKNEGGRLTDSAVIQSDFGIRLHDWHYMLRSTGGEWVVGKGYEESQEFSEELTHPHNVFVWAWILGGLPAAILLVLAFSSCASRLGVLWQNNGQFSGNISFVFFAIIMVFMFNSWAKLGTPVMGFVFGVVSWFEVSARIKKEDWLDDVS